MNCRFCGRVFNRPCGLAIHERTCKLNPDRKPIENHACNFKIAPSKEGWLCIGCNTKLRTRKELNEHKLSCTYYHKFRQYNKQYHPKREMVCTFCNKKWVTTVSGFKTHVKYCEFNPNKNIRKVVKHSESSRKLISECRKQTMLKQGCEQNLKHRSYLYNGKLFSSSYEIKYALYCEEHNIEYILHPDPIRYMFNNEYHLYFPDFYIPSENKYVDPKNSYLINHPQKHLGISDSEKIKLVSEQNSIIIEIIDGKDIVCNMGKLNEILKQNNK